MSLLDDAKREYEKTEAAIERIDKTRAKRTPKHEALKTPSAIARDPDILARFREAVQLCGLTGEIQNAQLIYLAITSRLLDRPVSIGVKGHSASGKSYTVDKVLQFFPDDAMVKFTGMSERALIYRDDDYQHRTIVVYEVTGLREGNEDDLTSYFIRSLLSEGRINYDVTIRGKDGQYTTQTIVKEGPTNIVFTTTKTRVHAENETRILSLNTDDGSEQTKNILAVLAEDDENDVDLTEWRDFQSWLATTGARVTIPYGKKLAALVPPLAVRLRRDFSSVLALIKAHALLHQLNRERDEKARIIATLDDYRAVRELVVEVISEGLGTTVRESVRETVQAVEALAGTEGAKVLEVAKELDLDRSATSRRIRCAADEGFIRNIEEKKGRAGRWVLGDPLPEAVEVLPAPEALYIRPDTPAHLHTPECDVHSAQPGPAETQQGQGVCSFAPVQEGIHTPADGGAPVQSMPARSDIFAVAKEACIGTEVDPSRLTDHLIRAGDPEWLTPAAVAQWAQKIALDGWPE